MNAEQITCPRCGEPAQLYTSASGRYLTVHGDPVHRVGGFEYPPFVATRDEAVAAMVAPYTGNSPGSCPQAWEYDPLEDGEPDCAQPY